jgi:hypothetical protein
MLTILVCVLLGAVLLTVVRFRVGYAYFEGYVLSFFLGAMGGFLLGSLLATIIGASVPYKGVVVDTRQLVQVQDSQGVHPGFYLSSKVVKKYGNDVTTYFYYYQVPGGYNPDSVSSETNTIVVKQDPGTSQVTVVHSQTVFQESWFALVGVEFHTQQYEFNLLPNTYHSSDQLGNN